MASYKYAGFKLPAEYYHPQILLDGMTAGGDGKTAEEVFKIARAEYQRLRRVEMKRLKSFERAGETSRKGYTENVDKYKPVSEIGNFSPQAVRELAHLLPELERTLSAERGSLAGSRAVDAKIIAALNAQGHTWINKDNFAEVAAALDSTRDSAASYASEQVLQIVKTSIERGYDPLAEVDKWKEAEAKRQEQRELAKTARKNKKSGTSAEKMRKSGKLRNI